VLRLHLVLNIPTHAIFALSFLCLLLGRAVGAGNSADYDLVRGQLGPAYIAEFSSRGPTSDGRTKPDIIAPGKFILSANAGGDCDPSSIPRAGSQAGGVLSMSGTSMATPGVSGSAAIIRQYFMEGHYPDGVKNETNAMTPSAALMKAVILNGGRRLDGVDNGSLGVENSQPYDQIQNFGHLSFVDSIYIPNVSNVKAQVWDREVNLCLA
jgi:subtilisin family serine protease